MTLWFLFQISNEVINHFLHRFYCFPLSIESCYSELDKKYKSWKFIFQKGCWKAALKMYPQFRNFFTGKIGISSFTFPLHLLHLVNVVCDRPPWITETHTYMKHVRGETVVKAALKLVLKSYRQLRNPHFFQKCCHICWLCFDFRKNHNTFERNEDCLTVFLKRMEF